VTPLLDGIRAALRQRSALAFAFLARIVLAYLIASPLARVLMGAGIQHHPRGDAVLFEPGAVALVEAVRVSLGELRTELGGSLVVGIVGAWLLLIPHGALYAALGLPDRARLAELLPRSLALFPRFTLLGGACAFVQGLILTLAFLGASGIESRFATAGSERRADLLALGVLAIAVLLVAFTALWLDLARAAVVVDDARFFSALGSGFRAFLRRPLAAIACSTLGPLCLLGLIAAAAVLTGLLDVSRVGTWRVLLVLALHQLVVLGAVLFRAGWLGASLELVRGPDC
jgi:hypothetical protein